MDKLSGKGFAVATVLWLLILFFASGEASCLSGRCDRSDLIMAGIAGAGFLLPAYFVATLLGGLFKPLLGNSKTDSTRR